MVMERWESVQRQKGNIAGAEMAKVLRNQFGDVPFPSVVTPEKQLEIKRFSKEQKEALEKQGFVIYGLTGQSIKTLRDSGHKFWSTWHKELPDFEALGSMHSEVAINPNKPFLPKSNNKTLAQQEDMIGKFSEELGKKVLGVKAIIGQAPDYVELAFAHLDSTKEYLFGAKNNYDYARTKTPTSSSDVAGVGSFYAVGGLAVCSWIRDRSFDIVHAAPLVVPV
jgi:hypothetical protein